jgi:hypothetical protein
MRRQLPIRALGPGRKVETIAAEGDRLSDLSEQDSYSYHLATVHVGTSSEAELEQRYRHCAEALQFEFDD